MAAAIAAFCCTQKISRIYRLKRFEAGVFAMREGRAQPVGGSRSRYSSKCNLNPGKEYNNNLRILCKEGRLKKALDLLDVTYQQGFQACSSTYRCLLQQCIKLKAFVEGKRIHAQIVKAGFGRDILLGGTLVRMYIKSGDVMNAREVFDNMPERTLFVWNVMIAGYADYGCGDEALKLFWKMQSDFKPDKFIITSVLKACASLTALEEGKIIHDYFIRSGIESDVFLESALVNMYVKCGSLENARQVFERISQRDVVLWTAMIAGYVHYGHIGEAFGLFRQMRQEGVKPTVVSWTTIIAGYAQNGHLNEALELFQQMQWEGTKPDTISWNALVTGYAQHGRREEALALLRQMERAGVKPDIVSWNAVIVGYAQDGHYEEAYELFQQLQCKGMKPDVFSWTAVIAGYAQQGHTKEALTLFRQMQQGGLKPNVVSWNALITGYVHHGDCNEAINLFWQMQQEAVKPDNVTFISILNACASLGALEQGKWVHANIIKSGIESDLSVGSALIDMYAKSGSLENACRVFWKMSKRDVVSWNALIAGYALHGHGKMALQFFKQMQQEGLQPNYVTFLSVLAACIHTGLVDDGNVYFYSILQDHDIIPSKEHYTCMVDLLGRAACLNEAVDFINKMPVQPDPVVWQTLLGACRIHGNIELAEHASDCALKLEPGNITSSVLLSNMYGAASRWYDQAMLRNTMKGWVQ